MDTRLKPIVEILISAAFWSTIGLASIYSGNYVVLAFFRSLTASAVAIFFARPGGKAAAISGVLLGVLFTVYPLAAVLVGLGPAAYLLYTAPLWTTSISAALGERPTRNDMIAVALVTAAVALMFLETHKGVLSAIGLAAGLASGASYGSYIAVARFYSRRGMDVDVSLRAMPYTLAVTAPATAAYVALYGLGDVLRPLALGIYLGVLCTVVPYRLFSSGVKVIGAAKASVIATLEPVLAALWGYLLLGQRPDEVMLIAYVLITAAAILASAGG